MRDFFFNFSFWNGHRNIKGRSLKSDKYMFLSWDTDLEKLIEPKLKEKGRSGRQRSEEAVNILDMDIIAKRFKRLQMASSKGS